ncbi:class I mannose-6-phosphate isomerase [Cytophagaceae bacterium YF14B1]|uniref:Class I mannose-6-phosphate isomerase n=1 Tax=Xanthocytophaga flava TaxID=3048013 RepID=A0AAE3QWC6_9BACT|nr:class I mannose-6-phosphate isomerase [Xanthocytophaga flavus]MDJ1486231.1 class I mannose-6-phosphate isomerase [Xanthocytophaga flavus]
MSSHYNKFPKTTVSADSQQVIIGWPAILAALTNQLEALQKQRVILVVDTYQGVNHTEAESAFRSLPHTAFFKSTDAFKSVEECRQMVYPDLTDDPVFGRITNLTIKDFFEEEKVSAIQAQIQAIRTGLVIVYGEGASYLVPQPDLLLYLDMPRWEIQLRMRQKKVSNLGVDNAQEAFSRLYKQSYFIDWRVLDLHKKTLFNRLDYYLDTTQAEIPKMVSGATYLEGLSQLVQQPFRPVPFFDPGPWGGQWMKEVMGLDSAVVNFAWGFDCVPEENSLLLAFGDISLETPAINLVFLHAQALLGEHVHAVFGEEFPIRFDMLDTMDGGNLSLQVHPTREYIHEHFSMPYTQDESYYFLDAKPDAFVYLGVKEGIDPDRMITALEEAQHSGNPFDADGYVNKWPVKKHDHALIPAGTIHCSGKNSMVLEISATPYIFTFKLWDWGRMGLDGKPRPIHIEHGRKVIQWERDQHWTAQQLLDQIEVLASGEGWKEERTGLHALEFIETRRHWFTSKVSHHTQGTVHVLNLVEGDQVLVESPTQAFAPFEVHYAETFVVPAAVGEYTIRPIGNSSMYATMKAYVRNPIP